MDGLDLLVFSDLFKAAYSKCFGHAIKNPMTETESKLFCNKVLDQTGLSVGWKSVKNYSFFIIDASLGKQENPSVATLDTLARYVLSAPYTNEIQRKNEESHYPYWFLYKEKFDLPAEVGKKKKYLRITGAITIIIIGILAVYKFYTSSKPTRFTDDFKFTDETTLFSNGWFLRSKDQASWNKRGLEPGSLTLYTLKGDNWPDPSSKPGIKNLLLRSITSDCFTAEVHMHDFIPEQEWQQAGILLLEDTSFAGKSMRLSLGFNDYFGGMKKPREILIQAITSLGNNFGKPEEIAHKIVFYPDSINNVALLQENLKNSALRIEKHGNKYRFLYAAGAMDNGAFKEVVTQEFEMKPKFIGIFAIKGFTDSKNIPVSFRYFSMSDEECN